MLEAKDISVKVGAEQLLDGVSAEFAPGRLSVILGPNGAGKSTLLACLSGLRKADGGSAIWDGADIAAMNAKLRARSIGLLPQSAAVHWDIYARDLVALGRYPYHGISNKDQDESHIEAAMAATDCTHFAGRHMRSLSGGERARVLLARVLAGQPQWLLADEPLAGLDPRYQMQILDHMRKLANEGVGVVTVLHDLNQAARIADHVLLLNKGRVFASGLPRDVLTKTNLKAVYDIDCAIFDDKDGQMAIIMQG
ncbi:MAG: ABC transporter ATP-binding protein [Sphingomonadales bacterium]|nr:ABC transporter ATP-binding protein [Sphingomonadales bacterium]